MNHNKFELKKTFGSFFIGDFEVALPIEIVQEVVNYPKNVTPVPLSPDYLVGIFNLRGMIIPVIHLSKLLGSSSEEGSLQQKKIAITQYHDIRIGLVFDATSEILKVSQEDLEQVAYNESSEKAIIKGILKLNRGERLLQMIDPEDLIKLDDIPHILSKVRSTGGIEASGALKAKKLQAISFSVGEVSMATPMKDIFEIIKIPKLQKGFVNYPYFSGMVNLRGMMIPVIDFGKCLEFSRTSINEESSIEEKRIIILNLAQNLKLGLLVDAVENIMSHYPEDVLPMPSLTQKHVDLYAGIMTRKDGESIFMLNCDYFVTDKEIMDIINGHAKLFQDQSLKEAEGKKNLAKETFISFKMNSEYCFPILDIREVIEFPKDITRPIGAPQHIIGVHHLRGNAVTLVDLKILHGQDDRGPLKAKKVIILKKEGQYVGLVVDSVEDIFSVYTRDKFPCPDLMKNGMDQKVGGVIKEFLLINDGKDVKNKKVVVLDSQKFFEAQLYQAA